MTSVLTDLEIDTLWVTTPDEQDGNDFVPFARAIEAAVIKRLAAGVSVEPVWFTVTGPDAKQRIYTASESHPENCIPLYTATAIAAARVRENERIADWYYNNKHRLSVFEVPDAIRALLRKEPT